MKAQRERVMRHRSHANDSSHGETAADHRNPSFASRQGKPLPPALRSTLEPAFQHDFRNVRIYDDPSAASLAASSHALAMTHGDRIAFGSGEYAPDTPSGQLLLAHELAHVVQQSRLAPDGPSAEPPSIATESALEHDADSAALCAVMGESAPVQMSAAPAIARAEAGGDSIMSHLKEKKEGATGLSDALEWFTGLFGDSKPKPGPNLERMDKGLSPLQVPGLQLDGALEQGSSAHVMENLHGKAGGGATWGKTGKMALGLAKGVASDVMAGKGATDVGYGLSKNLAKTVASPALDDMLKHSGTGALSRAGGTVSALNNAAKFVGAPEELTGSVDAATAPLSAAETTITEGAGSWFNILDAGASWLAGDEHWSKRLEEQNAKGQDEASFLQPLYWAGEAASGGWDKLSQRMIGKEGRSGKMGTFVEAGNYWGDVMAGDRSLSGDLGDIGSFMWGGLSGEGGIKGAGNAALDAGRTALDYWTGDGKNNLARDASDMWDFGKQAFNENVTLENAQKGAEGITRFVGGDKLVGMTRDASDYWGKVASGEGHLGKDLSDIGSFIGDGASNVASSAWKKITGIFD